MILFLLACITTPIQSGDVTVCLDGGRPTADLALDVAGPITAVGEGDCGAELTMEDGDGIAHTIGYAAKDGDAADITPVSSLAVGDTVQLAYDYRFVWGDVAGFAIYADDGLVVAADEGVWGGAFALDMLDGLTVSYGDKLGTEETDCMPMDGYTMVFHGDSDVVVEPINSAEVEIGGVAVQALAVAAWQWGQPHGCQVSDTTDHLAWVVSR